MEEECVKMCGMTGTFFTTNKAYQIPYPLEKDFHPFPEMLQDSESESDDGVYQDAVAPATLAEDESDDIIGTVEGPPPTVTTPDIDKATKSLIAKMRENAYEARRKKIEL